MLPLLQPGGVDAAAFLQQERDLHPHVGLEGHLRVEPRAVAGVKGPAEDGNQLVHGDAGVVRTQNKVAPLAAAGGAALQKCGAVRTIEHPRVGDQQLPQRKLRRFGDGVQRHLVADQIRWHDRAGRDGDAQRLRCQQNLMCFQIKADAAVGVPRQGDDADGIAVQGDLVAILHRKVDAERVDAVGRAGHAALRSLVSVQPTHQHPGVWLLEDPGGVAAGDDGRLRPGLLAEDAAQRVVIVGVGQQDIV